MIPYSVGTMASMHYFH